MQRQNNLPGIFAGFLVLFFMTSVSVAATINPVFAENPPTTGNFSLATSQQPGAFFSFGQNIIDKHQWLFSFNPSYLSSKSQNITETTPALLYGITDSASILMTLPYAVQYNNGGQNISGIGDLAFDLEYAFYNYENARYSDQATVIFSPTFPVSTLTEASQKTNPGSRTSGFSRKNAPSSFDAFSYFVGGTYSRTLEGWYGYVAPGVLYIEENDLIAQGTQYYYNVGIGHAIKTVKNKYIFFGLLEISGQYSDKTRWSGEVIPNTGGNIIYATPSLWLSTPKIAVQFGLSLPVAQYWYGNQSKVSYYASSILTWTIS